VEFTAEFSSGAVLTKRLEIPFSVYDVDCAAPNLGPFTVNRFDLSGVVDFSALDSLGLPHGYTEVIVYQDSGARIGSASVNAGSWSLGIMTEETSLPARIVLRTNIPSLGYIYDEITTSLSASRSDLDFAPGPLSAGTVYNGRSIGNNYSYLFAPDSAGNYAFKLSGAGSGYADLTLYDTSGNSLAYTSGNPDAALACSLSAGTACYIQLYLESPSRAFQFQVNPVSQANLGGTVDFSGLLSHLSGVSVSNAAVSVYAGSGAHTLLGTGTVNTGSWSAAVDLDGPSVPAVFVVAANLDNGRTVYHQEAGVISGNDSGLIFSPAAVTGESSSTRMTVNQYDYLLYVPTETGDYSLRVNAGAHYYMELTLYDAQTGNHIANTYGYDELELISELNVGTPYRVSVHSDAYFATYQFQAEVLEPVTLSGSVNLNGLAPLSGDINYTEISVYNGAASPVQLGSATADAIGSWSALIPASGTQTVRIVARVSLKSGREITACIEAAISGDTAGLDLAPAALSPAGTPIVRAGAYSRDGFLLVPSASGFFNLEAISGSYTPDLALYDTAGAALANGSSGSLYAALTAGTPYIVYVYNIGSFTPYQFRMTAMSSMSIGGTVNYTGLPASIRAIISSATVGGYVDNPAHTLVVSNTPVADESWSALVPAAATGQTVRLALTLHLSNGRSIYSQIQTVLAASATDLDFAPSVVSGGGAAISGKTAANGDDQFLIVPSAGGVYELQAGSDTYIRLAVYNGLTGDGIESSSYNYLSSVITPALNAETPYIISISANGYSFHDYQFSFDALPPVTLGGSVDFSGLSAWTSDSAGVLIFAGANYALLGTGAVNLSGNSWSASASLPGEVFIALVALSSGGEGVLETQTVSVSGDNNSIAFSPQDSGKNLATGQWHDRSAAAGSRGDWLLWIPENTGEYALDAERTDGSWDTYMYLYDGLSGAQIASDDDGGDGNNSRIQRSDFIAWKPYLVRVRGYGNNAGTFRFKAEMVSN
jgi:hypothetical protein